VAITPLAPNRLGEAEEVRQDIVSWLGEDRFRMKLDPFHHIIAMPYSHYLPILSLSSDFEAGWKTFEFDNQGMVASSSKGGS